MNIAIDGNEANQKIRAGSGVYGYNLLVQFSKLKDRSLNFYIFLKDDPVGDMPQENDNFIYKILRPRQLWTQIALPVDLYKNYLRNKITGIFFTPGHFAPRFSPIPSVFTTFDTVFFTPGHFAPRFSPLPTVITLFDTAFIKFPRFFPKNDLFKLRNWTSYSIKNAEKILTISECSKKDIIKYYRIIPDKVTVTYPGYDSNRFNKNVASDSDRKRGILDKYKISRPYILFVGTLQPRKNLIRLLESFEILKHRYKDLKLVVAGMINEGRGGWMSEEFFFYIKSRNLDDDVIITGYIPDEDLPFIMSGASVFILPSLYEGFGIPIIEAMACGVPVVASKVSSIPEIAGECAVLVDPENVENISQGLEKTLVNTALRKKLIRKGYVNATKFSWEKCAGETLKVLKSVTF